MNEFDKWLAEFTTPERYMVVVTEENEIVLVPTKATGTLNLGYIKLSSPEDFGILLKALETGGYEMVKVKRIEWDLSKPIGVTTSLEE